MRKADYYINKYKDREDYLETSTEIIAELNEDLKKLYYKRNVTNEEKFKSAINEINKKYNKIARELNKHIGEEVYKRNAFKNIANIALDRAIKDRR